MITEEVKKQWARPMSDFKWNVKCCYNCPNWEKDITLMADYAYNYCKETSTLCHFDHYCEYYKGIATEENLLVNLSQEECDKLYKELGN